MGATRTTPEVARARIEAVHKAARRLSIETGLDRGGRVMGIEGMVPAIMGLGMVVVGFVVFVVTIIALMRPNGAVVILVSTFALLLMVARMVMG